MNDRWTYDYSATWSNCLDQRRHCCGFARSRIRSQRAWHCSDSGTDWHRTAYWAASLDRTMMCGSPVWGGNAVSGAAA